MSKFKIGDGVIVTSPLGCGGRNYEGTFGDYYLYDTRVVVEVINEMVVLVDFDDSRGRGRRFCYNVRPSEIELDDTRDSPLIKALS